MSQRLNEFLAREAGDYLERVSRLLTGSATPDPAELLRLARGVRGSAQMAGAGEMAGLAERLEREARGLADGTSVWSEESREWCLRLAADMGALLQPADDDVIPVSELFFDDDLPQLGASTLGAAADSPRSAGDPGDDDAVSITDVLYDGPRALDAAEALRPALAEALAAGDPDRSRALFDELFDLIELARADSG